MATVVFCPVTFNLAETTRMIQVARALNPAHTPVFMGYEHDYVGLIHDAGFDYIGCEPSWSDAQRAQAIAFDQGRSLRSPFTKELVSARVTVERRLIRDCAARAVVTGSNLTSFISARAENVPLFYPVPFALTDAQVSQTRRMEFVEGDRWLARTADIAATAVFRWIYTRAPLAPRAFASVAKANGVAPLRTVASLLTADRNLVTEMSWELDGFTLPPGFERVGPIFAHVDAPMPDIVRELARSGRPLVYLGLGSSASRELALAAADALGRLDVDVVAPIRHYLRPGDAVPPERAHHRSPARAPAGRARRRGGPPRRPGHRADRLCHRHPVRRHGPPARADLACPHVRAPRKRDRGATEARRIPRVPRRRPQDPHRPRHPRSGR